MSWNYVGGAPGHGEYSSGGGSGYPGQAYHNQHQPQYSYGGHPSGGYNQSRDNDSHIAQQTYNPPSGPPPMPPGQMQFFGPHFQIQHEDREEVRQHGFQYSQCNGKKKALCIGINYTGTENQLNGCINDALNMQRFLCEGYGYRVEDTLMLTDDTRDARKLPTRENILQAMRWLVTDAQPNDSLFFHYSGHGGETRDTSGDEADGYDETIYPLDFKESGIIIDDDMHTILVQSLPAGCRLTAIFDCCHSGSALDLPYMYTTEGKIKEPNLLAEAGKDILSSGIKYARGDVGGAIVGLIGMARGAITGRKADEVTKRTRTSPADAISWSGCKDTQTSADTTEAGLATGAMSWAFIHCLRQNPQQSYNQLLNNIRHLLGAKYSQKPQLSSSHPIDTDLMFII